MQFLQDFRQWMIINHEFVENEVTPEMVLGLKPSLFDKKSSCLALIARYFIWMCKTQEKSRGKLQIFCINLCFCLLLMCPMPL